MAQASLTGWSFDTAGSADEASRRLDPLAHQGVVALLGATVGGEVRETFPDHEPSEPILTDLSSEREAARCQVLEQV